MLETQVSEYIIKELIGSGGMGVVYRAVQPFIGKQVAIKILKTEFAGSEELVRRLLVEARAVNAVQHRGIIDIFGFGQLPDGRPYVVMELLQGTPLDVFIWECKRVPIQEAVAILDEMLAGLGAAHRAGIVHRDLKPGNVFLNRGDEGEYSVKLLDFGIAKVAESRSDSPLTLHGHIMGTPEYMAPEQIRGKQVSPVTDLYSVGVIAFQMMTGKLPFTGESTQVLFSQVEDEPPAISDSVPDLPEELDVLVQRLLAKEPAQRLQSAELVRKELEPFLPRRIPSSKEFVRSDSGRIHAPTAILSVRTPQGRPLAELKRDSDSQTTRLAPFESPQRSKPWQYVAMALVALGLLGGGLGFMTTRDKSAGVPPSSTLPSSALPPSAEASPPLSSPSTIALAQTPLGSTIHEEAERPVATTVKLLQRKVNVASRGMRKPQQAVPVLPASPPTVEAPDPAFRAAQLQACFSIKKFDRRTQQKELLLARIECLKARSRVDNPGLPDTRLIGELAQIREESESAETATERMTVTLKLDAAEHLYDQQYGRLGQ